MTDRPQITVQPRQVLGKKVKHLRREGFLPANIHGPKIQGLAVQLPRGEFAKLYRDVGESELIDLMVEKEKKPRPVLMQEVQLDPVLDTPLHVDFLQVDLTEKIEVDVPIEFIGEAPAVRDRKGILLTILDELPIKVLPTEIPHAIGVDVSGLVEVNDAVTVADLELPEGVELMVEDAEAAVVKIEEEAKTLEEEAEEEKAKEAEKTVEGEAVEGEGATEETKLTEESSE